MSKINVDTVIAGYVKLRDKRAQLKKDFADQDTLIKEQQDKLEGYLMQIMQDSGADQLGSSHGTAFKQIKSLASSTDWYATWQWLAEHKRLDMLEKRLSSKIVKEYVEETGELPPGVRIESKASVVIRRTNRS